MEHATIRPRSRRTLLRVEARQDNPNRFNVGSMVKGVDKLGYARAAWHNAFENLDAEEARDAVVQTAGILAAAIGETPGFMFVGVPYTLQTVFIHAVDGAFSR